MWSVVGDRLRLTMEDEDEIPPPLGCAEWLVLLGMVLALLLVTGILLVRMMES